MMDPAVEPEWSDYKTIPANGLISAPNCWAFETILTPGLGSNSWYNKPDIGKYGAWTEIFGAPDSDINVVSYGELKFINFRQSRHKCARY